MTAQERFALERKAKLCPYCDGVPALSRKHGKDVWRCDCGAYVGCHPGTTCPLGIVADKETRDARREAHLHLDFVWRNFGRVHNVNEQQARRKAYRWMGRLMGLNKHQMHIAMFTAEQCRQLIQHCKDNYHGIYTREKDEL